MPTAVPAASTATSRQPPASPKVIPTVAVIGDLTAQHDLGSLVLMRERPLVVIVVNNGGGGIFDYLPLPACQNLKPVGGRRNDCISITPRLRSACLISQRRILKQRRQRPAIALVTQQPAH